MRTIFQVWADVATERIRQDEKWGEQNHPDGTGTQYQDTATQHRWLCAGRHRRGAGSWADILLEETYEALAESDPAKLREELIQVAAVAMAWAEAIDRRE